MAAIEVEQDAQLNIPPATSDDTGEVCSTNLAAKMLLRLLDLQDPRGSLEKLLQSCTETLAALERELSGQVSPSGSRLRCAEKRGKQTQIAREKSDVSLCDWLFYRLVVGIFLFELEFPVHDGWQGQVSFRHIIHGLRRRVYRHDGV